MANPDRICLRALAAAVAFAAAVLLQGCVTPGLIPEEKRHAPASGTTTTTVDSLLADSTTTTSWDDRMPQEPPPEPPPTKAEVTDHSRETQANLRDCLSISAEGTECGCFDGLGEKYLSRLPYYKQRCLEPVNPNPTGWPELPPKPKPETPPERPPKPNPGLDLEKGKAAAWRAVERILGDGDYDAQCKATLSDIYLASEGGISDISLRDLANAPRSWAPFVIEGAEWADAAGQALIDVQVDCPRSA